MTAANLVPLLIVGALSLIGTWLLSRIKWQSLLDMPGDRSLHEVPVSRFGGLAILASFFIGCLLFSETVTGLFGTTLLGLMVVLALVSVWDDLQSLSPLLRFLFQCLIAGLTVFVTGLYWHADFFGWPVAAWVAQTFCFFAVVWVVNLYNFMDGMDGFAGGMGLFGFGSLALIGFMAGDSAFGLANALLVMAIAGFWVWNFPPAKIFMGDAGSTFLGYMGIVMSLIGWQKQLYSIWVPILIFTPFWVDATYTLITRILRKEKFWLPHRSHFYQRLVLMGLGHKKVVLLEYGLMALCAGSALMALHKGMGYNETVPAVWALLYIFLVVGLEVTLRKHESSSSGT